jgi:hypothetical protein
MNKAALKYLNRLERFVKLSYEIVGLSPIGCAKHLSQRNVDLAEIEALKRECQVGRWPGPDQSFIESHQNLKRFEV